jgi:hypothetical protein
MNRLTRRNGAGSAIPNNGFGGLTNSAGQQIINALAAYEDTGLTPEEVAELAKAKADGRLVVLPCKVGDTVYFLIPELEMGEGGFNLSGLFISEPHRITEVGTRGFWTSGLPRDKPDGMHDFTPWGDLGKTVFLTRAEAEAALRKEQSDER